ncbi:MAG: histidinol-phosphate transaminase [Elusimicrobiota bacterium]|jgi:histidinol-phosphate aminotransferase|nr:histidinol-phosphate transaminase [Elusimicrobiota bacterium]
MLKKKLNVNKLLRKEVLNFEPYIPGKPIDELKRELGLKNIYKLASNENSFGVSQKVIANIPKIIKNLNRYPDSNCYILRKALSKKFNIPEKNFVFGNGSDEIIELLGKTFLNQSDEIIVSKHSFVSYKMSAAVMGAKTKIAKMTKDLVVDLNAIFEQITDNTKLIFIGNPNNPTGTYIKRDDFIKFMEKIPSNILVFMDEAYYEFAKNNSDYPDSLELQKKYQNILVSRTFSKLFALAGLRLGYMIATENVIKAVNKIRLPFNVNIIAQNIAIEALKDEEHIKKTLAMVEYGKKFLYSEFEKLGIKYFKTAGNFILFDAGKKGGKRIFLELLNKGIIIRAVDEYDLKKYARVSVGTKTENENFIKALTHLYE